MSASIATRDSAFEPVDNARLANSSARWTRTCGRSSSAWNVQVRRRGGWVEVSGPPEATVSPSTCCGNLFELSAREALTPDRVHLAVQEARMDPGPSWGRAQRTK